MNRKYGKSRSNVTSFEKEEKNIIPVMKKPYFQVREKNVIIQEKRPKKVFEKRKSNYVVLYTYQAPLGIRRS